MRDLAVGSDRRESRRRLADEDRRRAAGLARELEDLKEGRLLLVRGFETAPQRQVPDAECDDGEDRRDAERQTTAPTQRRGAGPPAAGDDVVGTLRGCGGGWSLLANDGRRGAVDAERAVTAGPGRCSPLPP